MMPDSKTSVPVALALVNLFSNDTNPGLIIRMSALLGLSDIFMFGRRKYDRRVTKGIHRDIHITTFGDEDVTRETIDWTNVFQCIRIHEYTPVILHAGGDNLASFRVAPHLPVCFVLGMDGVNIPSYVCEDELWYDIPVRHASDVHLPPSLMASMAVYHTLQQL